MAILRKGKKIKSLKTYLMSRFIIFLFVAGLMNGLIVSGLDMLSKVFGESEDIELSITRWEDVPVFLGVIILVILLLILLYGVPYGICIWIYSKMVTKKVAFPVGKIIEGMQEVTRGDKDVILDFDTEYEFVGMRDTFNYMTREMGKVEKLQDEYEKQRSLLLSGMAHDLKNPIMTISGYAKALSDGIVVTEEKKKEYLDAIYHKSLHINELVTMLFEYTQLDSKGFQLNKERVDLIELIRSTIATMYTDFEEREMELELEVPEHPVYINIDKTQFSRAITNVIVNALKHNPKQTKILIRYSFDDKHQILIADSGVEIPEKIASTIFDPFVLGDDSRSSKNGSGIGLSITMKVIKMHGGSIHLVQEIEGYTKGFLVSLSE